MRRYARPIIMVTYRLCDIYAAAAANFGSPGGGLTP